MGTGFTEEWGWQLRLEAHRDKCWVVGREKASQQQEAITETHSKEDVAGWRLRILGGGLSS